MKNAFQIISISPPLRDGEMSRPTIMRYSYTGRLREGSEYLFAQEAIRFAEEHWGSSLVEDNWADYIEFVLDDPSDLNERQYPRTKMVIGVGLARRWNDMINDHSVPQSETLATNVVVASVCGFERQELKGGRGGFTDFNCAYCGSGLSLAGCGGCGHRFRDNHFRSGWHTPLPMKLIDVAREAGLEFKKDPQIAIDAERALWEKHCQERERRKSQNA